MRRATALLAMAVFLGFGCTSPESRYKVLSFFFDGVPNPNPETRLVVRQTSTGRPLFVHEPFASRNCDACHTETKDVFARIKVRPEQCYTCHEGVLDAYPRMHGPVVTGECLHCHAPHQSVEPHLLKRDAFRLCTNCHLPETLVTSVPEHMDLKSSCIDCHSGHGGSDLNFLKPILPAKHSTEPFDAMPVDESELPVHVSEVAL